MWFKRDNLCGLGGGGTKVRKLEWTCAAAMAAGARLGMDVVLVLSGAPDVAASGNLALDGLFGARVVWVRDHGQAPLDEVTEAVAGDLRRAGAAPYAVPFGGSSQLAAQGHAECGAELLRQIPDVSSVVVASVRAPPRPV